MIQLKLLQCQQCGAGLNLHERTSLLRCIYCQSTYLVAAPAQLDRLSISQMVTFSADAASASRAIRAWMGQGLLIPGDLAEIATMQSPQPVFLPFYRVRCQVRTHWTAEIRHTDVRESEERSFSPFDPVPGARKKKVERHERQQVVAGTHEGTYRDVLVAATNTLTADQIEDLGPFDLSGAIAFDAERAGPVPVTEPKLVPADLRATLEEALEPRERAECMKMIGSRVSDMRVNLSATIEESILVYLPVFLASFDYQGTKYPLVLHGQTLEIAGSCPRSPGKVAALLAALVGVPAAVLCYLLWRRRA